MFTTLHVLTGHARSTDESYRVILWRAEQGHEHPEANQENVAVRTGAAKREDRF